MNSKPSLFITYAAHCLGWLSYGKNCGRGNKQLGTKVLAAKNVAEGEAGAKIS